MEPVDRILDELNNLQKPSGRPLVTLSYAQSLDGSIAARRGFPLALSGPESSVLTHRLRAAHDAILVGIGTVLADNPRLTVRLVEGKSPQPLILDSCLRIPLNAALLEGRSPWIATTSQADPQIAAALEGQGAFLMYFPADAEGRVSLPALLERLDQIGVASVMVEGGACVIGSFMAGGLVDLMVLTIAPVLVGGVPAVARSLAEGKEEIQSSFPRLSEMSAAKLGVDLIVWGRPTWPRPSNHVRRTI
jgi:3,4-dihydroxy 2-butanone 4-phosphate synthase/GTP cyclohydrolase II